MDMTLPPLPLKEGSLSIDLPGGAHTVASRCRRLRWPIEYAQEAPATIGRIPPGGVGVRAAKSVVELRYSFRIDGLLR
jgi:hypothetical protein